MSPSGITELHKVVDTLLIIPNQNRFSGGEREDDLRRRVRDGRPGAVFRGAACITDLMVKEGLMTLDFADVRAAMREMGKAMTGTGEASGEKRALSAAEVAISNPLIDDSSMKGARGLLISITGGSDLTLYEVDEAATCIREEVDQDANIIVGETFDESLDGIIRVSVVATGIDQASMSRPATVPEARIAELTEKKLRAEQQRGGIQRQETRALATPTVPPIPPQQMPEAFENAARAAVAAAVLPMGEEVTIRQIPPKPSLFPEQTATQSDSQPVPRAFIPPAPERTPHRARRMPDIEELPRPAQAELRAKRGEQAAGDNPEKRKVGLLRRLAAVGLGRREEEEEPDMLPLNVRPVRPVQRPVDRTTQAPRAPTLPPVQPVSEYAKRPNQQGHDALGRQVPGEQFLAIPRTNSTSRRSCEGRQTDCWQLAWFSVPARSRRDRRRW